MTLIILAVIVFVIPLLNIQSINNWIFKTCNLIVDESTADKYSSGLFSRVKQFICKIGAALLKVTKAINNERLSASISAVVLFLLLLMLPLLLLTILPFYVAYQVIINISPNAKKIDDAFEKGKDFGRSNDTEQID